MANETATAVQTLRDLKADVAFAMKHMETYKRETVRYELKRIARGLEIEIKRLQAGTNHEPTRKRNGD